MKTLLKLKKSNYYIRYPNLQTVLMVENFIKENNSEFKKTELFENLPKKMMWGTFQIIMKYLEDNLKIIIEEDGVITYIWNPTLVKKMRDNPVSLLQITKYL